MLWRHGDIIIASTQTLPAAAKRIPGVVLARGEATGHAHTVDDTRGAELWECDQERYLRITAQSVRIVHQEHKPITIPEGLYRFWQQREYSPEAIRHVVD